MIKSAYIAASKITTEQVIDGVIGNALPLAIWSMPCDPSIHLLISKDTNDRKIELNIEDKQPGFTISPFESENGEAYFLPADFYQQIANEKTEILDFDPNIIGLSKESFQVRRTARNSTEIIPEEDTNQAKESFVTKVKKAIEEIEKGSFNKVVISRVKTLSVGEDFSPYKYFQKLCTQYPHAFVSMTYLPWLDELWIGASPETLVSQNQQGIFKTMALAGTQSSLNPEGVEIPTKEALWSQKEIEEQAFVSRYIINCLKKLRIREFLEEGPRTTKAGNLLHLSTTFNIDTVAINFPQLSSVMIKLLHPTSAVCGMPKDTAKAFILANEGFDRGFYSGFLGPVNINGTTHIFVNLRSMKLKQNELNVYAGCGITADSNPQKEWLETTMKMKTILLK